MPFTHGTRFGSAFLLASLLLAWPAHGEDEELIKTDGIPVRPKGNSADEPLAKTLSLARTAEFLDGTTVAWINQRKCGSCHTGYPYLFARAQLDHADAPAALRVRKFFEDRVALWDQGGKGAGYLVGKGRLADTQGVTEVVGVASALAMHDQLAGKLEPVTRRALARMWELQREDGSWAWNHTGLAPMEHDDYFGVVCAAVAVAYAPEEYVKSPEAREGVARLRKYLQANPAPDMHHKLWLLWASARMDGLVSSAEREAWLGELLKLQRADGGWSLHSMGDWKRRDNEPVNKSAPSDGYGTGLVVYVMRQLNVPASAEPVRRGVDWLETNQRESGRWFTRSANWDRGHFISAAGTAFAVLALKSCEAPK